MIELYELKQKTSGNPQGSSKVIYGANPFVNGPVLLCIGDNPLSREEAKATTNYFANVLRLRTPESDNARISLEGFPINLVSYNSVPSNNQSKDQEIEFFVTQYLSPLVERNLVAFDPIIAMKKLRNLNIVTFGNGVNEAISIEDKLVEHMQRLGFDQENIRKILSQVFAVYIGAPKVKDDELFTAVSFSEIEDQKIDRTKESSAVYTAFRHSLKYDLLHEGFKHISNNLVVYSKWNPDSKHSLRDYCSTGTAFPVVIASVLYEGLNNSAINITAKDTLLPLTMSQVTSQIETFRGFARQNMDYSTMIQKFDERIKYPGMKVLTEGELRLQRELDVACGHIVALQNNPIQEQSLPGLPNNDGGTTLPGVGSTDYFR